jgi:hypothetical protein
MLEAVMSGALVVPGEAAENLRRWVWSRSGTQRFESLGLFDGQRWELIEGELYDKVGQNPPHAHAIRKLAKLLRKLHTADMVEIQMPIDLLGTDRECSIPEAAFLCCGMR